MDIRRLIVEEVQKALTCDHDPQALRRDIPFEHDIQILKNTQFTSPYHLGSKAISAKEMGLNGKTLNTVPVKNVPFERGRDMTEREKDYNRFFLNRKFGCDGEFQKSKTVESIRMDGVMYGTVMRHFNVKAMYEDVNGNCVIKVSLKGKNVDIDKVKHEKYIPGGRESKRRLVDIAKIHGVPMDELLDRMKNGVKVEMSSMIDELQAIAVVKDNLMHDPFYYDEVMLSEEKFENSMGVSAYNPPNATPMEQRMDKVLKEVNKLFGTHYFVKTMYPERFEQVYVIESGRVNLDGSVVEMGKLVNFTEEENMRKAIVGMLGGADDGSPWREITEPLNVQPYRSAVVGKGYQNA